MPYTLKLALKSLWREKWINLLTALTIGTGLAIMALSFVFVHNIRLATGKLPERFSMTVFLADGISDDKVKALVTAIKLNSSVKAVKYISKDDALRELKGLMKDSEFILEGLEENPLPASVEVTLKKESVNEASVRRLSKEFSAIDGVENVSYAEKFITSIQAIRAGAEGVAIFLSVVLTLSVLFVCYSTVKILFYRKKDEIETLQLLGATGLFIRAPFLLEGGLIGLAAGLAALGLLSGLKYAVSAKVALYVPVLASFSYPSYVIYLPVAGLLVGVAGAFIAVGRLRL